MRGIRLDENRKCLRMLKEENGGPCRGRTYGPLIKSTDEILPTLPYPERSEANNEDED